jgi:hypothetical protein
MPRNAETPSSRQRHDKEPSGARLSSKRPVWNISRTFFLKLAGETGHNRFNVASACDLS